MDIQRRISWQTARKKQQPDKRATNQTNKQPARYECRQEDKSRIWFGHADNESDRQGSKLDRQMQTVGHYTYIMEITNRYINKQSTDNEDNNRKTDINYQLIYNISLSLETRLVVTQASWCTHCPSLNGSSSPLHVNDLLFSLIHSLIAWKGDI